MSKKAQQTGEAEGGIKEGAERVVSFQSALGGILLTPWVGFAFGANVKAGCSIMMMITVRCTGKHMG